jgi:hypothetical protein
MESPSSRTAPLQRSSWVALAARVAAVVAMAGWPVGSPALAGDPGRIDAYVTPFYNSNGPAISVGRFSAGLGSKSPQAFVATILRMKKEWSALSFPELYVGAIRLYDRGYRREGIYWFYSAQYKGRQFALLADQKKLGGVGDPGFELYHAQNAFFEVVGPDINGYAFGDVESLIGIIRKVQSQNKIVPDLRHIYAGVAFVPASQWQRGNAQLNSGLGQLADQLANQKSQIAQQRAQNGTQARFGSLASKQFPGGL